MIGIQDVLVTMIAVAAALVIVQRLVSVVAPTTPKRRGSTPCASCGPSCAASATRVQPPAAPPVIQITRRSA